MNRLRPLTRLQEQIVMPRLTRPDPWLLLATTGLVALGVVMVFNVSYFHAREHYGDPFVFFRRHVMSVMIGGVAMLVVAHLRLDVLERWANVALLLSVAALLLVLIPGIGVERGGAQRWMRAGGLSFQPSELAKVAVVLFLARWISRRRDGMHDFRRAVLPALAIAGLCIGLILLQPDFGTAAILGALLLIMLFVGGARPMHMGGLAGAGVACMVAAMVLEPYRMRRLAAFCDPWQDSLGSGFQLVQSLIAFGSGGVSGLGLGQSRQRLLFLPEAHTDFIFAFIGEELGMLGALAVLFLFAMLAVRGFRVAARHPDPFASLLAFGLTLVITLAVVVNVGVVLGLLPTKGLPLPFVSYGGSALLGAMMEVGMLAALSRMTG